jgi:diguanylate cyclase (GGDEF)-like protein
MSFVANRHIVRPTDRRVPGLADNFLVRLPVVLPRKVNVPADDEPMLALSWISRAKSALLFALLYVVADVALNRFAFSDGWTIIWPLNGVTIALMLARPRAAWPWMLAGIGIGTGIGECLDNNPIGLEIGQRVISLVEVLVSASLLPAFANLEGWLRQPRIFLKFSLALALGPGLSGILAAILFHRVQGQPYGIAFNNWATADALGIAATLPLALALRSVQMRALFDRGKILRTVGILAFALAIAEVIFSESQYPLLFLLYPALLMVDSLLGFPGAAIAINGVFLIAVYNATNGHGPFGHWPPGLPLMRDMALQIYLGFHTVALFPASILFMERKRMAEELLDTNMRLKLLASRDGLTGIANRRTLDERLVQEWRRATRLNAPLAMLMIDIDHFKQFNDHCGHPAGDQCLKRVAEALARQAREQDLVARFGGEEFALLLPHTDLAGALQMAERVRAAVSALAIVHVGSPRGHVTVSIGCAAVTPRMGESPSNLLDAADAALYRAKRGGRNRVEGAPAGADHELAAAAAK